MKTRHLLIFILLRLQKFQNFADIADYIVCTGLGGILPLLFFPLFSLLRGKVCISGALCKSILLTDDRGSRGWKVAYLSLLPYV